MAEQQGIEPSATVAPLVKNCWNDYNTPQEFANALASVLQISAAAGAQGAPGEDGEAAEAAVYGAVLVKTVPIPVGVTEVDCEIDLNGKIIQISIPDTIVEPGYDEVISPGMIAENTRLIFMFSSENDGTPVAPTVQQAGWEVKIYEITEVVT